MRAGMARPQAPQPLVPAHIRSACEEAARLLASGDVERAESRSRLVLEEAPDSADALFVLAQCVKRRPSADGEYEALLRRILRLAPYPQASLELAAVLLS